MRLQHGLELDGLVCDVPNVEDFVISRLCDDIGVHWAPTDGRDVVILEVEKLHELKCLLVIDVDRHSGCKGKLIL